MGAFVPPRSRDRNIQKQETKRERRQTSDGMAGQESADDERALCVSSVMGQLSELLLTICYLSITQRVSEWPETHQLFLGSLELVITLS